MWTEYLVASGVEASSLFGRRNSAIKQVLLFAAQSALAISSLIVLSRVAEAYLRLMAIFGSATIGLVYHSVIGTLVGLVIGAWVMSLIERNWRPLWLTRWIYKDDLKPRRGHDPDRGCLAARDDRALMRGGPGCLNRISAYKSLNLPVPFASPNSSFGRPQPRL
jgi:hypothetical protein